MKKLFSWLLVSNRLKHLKAGAIIFICFLMFLCVATSIAAHASGMEFNDAYSLLSAAVYSVTTLLSTLVAMCSVEYIQTTFQCKWDWLDVLAGCLVPLVFTVIISLAAFFAV